MCRVNQAYFYFLVPNMFQGVTCISNLGKSISGVNGLGDLGLDGHDLTSGGYHTDSQSLFNLLLRCSKEPW